MRGFGLFCAAEFEVGAFFVGYKAPLFHGLSALRRARLTESLPLSSALPTTSEMRPESIARP